MYFSIIEEFAGVLPFDDKASPEVIRREFGLSKNAFKRAVGHLLKEGKIEIKDRRIYLGNNCTLNRIYRGKDEIMNFTHLHVHTEYSLLDGSNKIKEYVARVKELGMDSAAITDHGVMYGVIDFYRAAKAAGINPILGCEVYVAPGSRFDQGSGKRR